MYIQLETRMRASPPRNLKYAITEGYANADETGGRSNTRGRSAYGSSSGRRCRE